MLRRTFSAASRPAGSPPAPPAAAARRRRRWRRRPRRRPRACPGTASVGSTRTRPLRPIGSPSWATTGAARMPAAQITVSVGRRSPPARTAASRGDLLDAGVRADVDAEGVQVAERARAELLGERRQDVRARLDDDDAHLRGIDVPIVARQHVAAELRQRTGHLHARRAGADDHERQQAGARRGSVRDARALERAERVVAERARVLQVVEPVRVLTRPRGCRSPRPRPRWRR